MRRILGLSVSLYSLLSIGIAAGAQTAGVQTAADRIRPISTITAGVHAKHDTLAHELLNDEAASSTVTKSMYDFLDALIDAALKRIPKKSRYGRDDALSAVKAIDDILTSMNVVYPAADTGMGMVDQLSDGLRGRAMNRAEIGALIAEPHNRRRIDHIRRHATEKFYVNDCDTTAFLYLAVAEILGLPLSMIDLPGHNFIRYEEDGEQFNWETLDAALEPDDFYRAQWRIPDALVAGRVYLAPMSRIDVIGYHFTITAAVWAKKHQDRRMLDDDEKAATLYPRGPRVWNQWAWNLVTASDPGLRDGKAATLYAARAVAISRTPNFLDTLACAQAATGDFDLALDTEQQAAKLAQTKDFPLDIAVPDFDGQIKRFHDRQNCADRLTP